MKKTTLWSSIVTIAICLSLIVGSTYALFTDETQFNIAITSGNVEIHSVADVVATYSAKGPVAEHSDKYLKDEYGSYYEHDPQTPVGSFFNSGSAAVDNGNVTISKITPGDKVDVKIITDNLGDVAFRFRYTIKVDTDNGLATGMVFTDHNGKEFEAVKSYTSEWFPMVSSDADFAPEKVFSLELPVYAGNEYQSEENDEKSVDYIVLVEAVQANAVVDGTTTEAVVYATESSIQTALNNGGVINGNNDTLVLDEGLGFISKDVTIEDIYLDGSNADAGDPKLALYGYDGTLTLGEGATLVAGDYAVFGERLTSVTFEEGSKIIVSGSSAAFYSMTYDYNFTTDIYLEAQGLIVDENGNVATGEQFLLMTAGNYVFHVPTVEAYNEYSAMVYADNIATVSWYVDGVLYNP